MIIHENLIGFCYSFVMSSSLNVLFFLMFSVCLFELKDCITTISYLGPVMWFYIPIWGRPLWMCTWATWAEGYDSGHVTSWTCLKGRKAVLSAGTLWRWCVQNPQLDYLHQGGDCWRDKPQLFSILRQFFVDVTLEWLMNKGFLLTFKYSIIFPHLLMQVVHI